MLDSVPSLASVTENLPTDLPSCAAPCPSPLPSFWTANSASPHNSNSSGPIPAQADVVIIGSGLTGSCIAAQLVEDLLARRKEKGEEVGGKFTIVVLEAREFCSGATGRNGGHLTPAPRYHFANIAEAYSVENAKRSVELEDRAMEWVLKTCVDEGWESDVDLVQGGCVRFFKDAEVEKAVRDQVNAAAANGVDISSAVWLSSEEALAGYWATTHSALRIPGNNLFPLKFLSKLFSRAQSQCEGTGISLEIFTSCEVKSVTASPSSPTLWAVATPRGPISAPYIIHATNAYASHLLPHLSSGPHCVVPTRGQVLTFAPSPSSNPHWTSAFSASESFEYFFQRENGGPVILGGGRAFSGPRFEFGLTDDGEVSEVVGKALREYLPEQFPKWFREGKEGRVEMEWTGIMGYRPSGEPLVGELFIDGKKVKGQYLSVGYSGHGMTRAPGCAEVIASMILADVHSEEFVLPTWFPTHYLSSAEASLEVAAALEAEPYVVVEKESTGWSCNVA